MIPASLELTASEKCRPPDTRLSHSAFRTNHVKRSPFVNQHHPHTFPSPPNRQHPKQRLYVFTNTNPLTHHNVPHQSLQVTNIISRPFQPRFPKFYQVFQILPHEGHKPSQFTPFFQLNRTTSLNVRLCQSLCMSRTAPPIQPTPNNSNIPSPYPHPPWRECELMCQLPSSAILILLI